MVRHHWHSKRLSICSEGGIIMAGGRLSCRMITLAGMEVILLTAYFEVGTGLNSFINRGTLLDIDSITRSGKKPFILGLDGNVEPEE